MANQYVVLSHDVVCEIFHRYFTLGQDLNLVAREMKLRRQTVQGRLRMARSAIGDLRECPHRPRGVADEYARGRLLKANDRFSKAMAAAIVSGKEHAHVGVITRPDDHSVRVSLTPHTYGSMTSPAGWD